MYLMKVIICQNAFNQTANDIAQMFLKTNVVNHGIRYTG